jgi:AraC-like DNA-binding protein
MKAHIFNFHDVFLLLTASLCLLLGVFQWLIFERRVERGILSSFYLSLAITYITVLLMWSDKIAVPTAVVQWLLPYTFIGSLMLHGPLLFLYVRMITSHDAKLETTDIWHAVPVGILFLVIGVFHISSTDLLLRLELNPPVDAVTIVWAIAKVQPVAYCVACWYMAHRYSRRLRDRYAQFSISEPAWLLWLSVGFLVSWSWSLLVHLLAKITSPDTADSLGLADNYVSFVLIIALFLYSLLHAQKLLRSPATEAASSAAIAPQPEQIARLENAMVIDKRYLENNLTLDSFAEAIQLPSRTVSQIINNHFNTNFFEYVNGYRVEEAKRLLADPSKTELTILDILLASGFNSKSAFHRFFSRLVGTSPTAFRRRALK